MGDLEFGKCDICGKEAPLSRTYFIYNIPCECCGCKEDGKDMHSELVRHCKNCVPVIPQNIAPLVKSGIDNQVYRLKIDRMSPYKIYGEFCIQFHSQWFL